MKEERLWELLSLKLSGEASEQDLAELDSLLNEYPEVHFKVAQLEQFWQTKQAVSPSIDSSFDRHLQRLSNHFSSPALQYEEQNAVPVNQPQKFFSRKFITYAAVAATLVITVSLVWLFALGDVRNKAPQNIVATKTGSKSKITLPDGSQVWLNAESNLTNEKSFGNASREVELTGEAFFDVVHDKDRPFIIHTKSIDVKVLGTAFNVRSYPGEKTAETSLIRGLVEVTLKQDAGKKILLKPNEKLVVQVKDDQKLPVGTAIYSDNAPLLTLSKLHYLNGDSTSVETSWIQNKLAFEEETLEEVAAKIGRWYGVNIEIKDDQLKESEYTGLFEDESLSEVLDALKLTGSFTYEINKKDVVIRP